MDRAQPIPHPAHRETPVQLRAAAGPAHAPRVRYARPAALEHKPNLALVRAAHLHLHLEPAVVHHPLHHHLVPSGYVSDTFLHGSGNFSHLASIIEISRSPALMNPGKRVQCKLVAIIIEISRSPALMNPSERVQCNLVAKKTVSHDVRLFRFALPSADQVLGLPVGKHIFLCATIDGKLCMRPYTPTSPVDEIGHFELLINVYFKGENPKFPNGGLMSQHLESLPIGSTLDVKGPLGHIEYAGRGNFLVDGKHRSTRRLAMIAGGTGITPVYQVIQAVLRDPENRTEMHLVYANRSEDDILLRDELDILLQKSYFLLAFR
nr:PREDICTED: nitrate reductase [NADH]-like [Musa acuminata subsp. malaccensis]